MWRNKSLIQKELFEDTEKHQEYIDNLAKSSTKDYLELCKVLARTLVKRHGVATTDDIREKAPVPDGVNPSVLGWVFRDPLYKCVGIKRRHISKGGAGYVNRWTFR